MAKITVEIKGIAIVYHKNDGVWKVLFPFDNHHQVNYKVGNETAIPLAQTYREIKITTEEPGSIFEIGKGYDKFIDLTDENYSHSKGVLKTSDWNENSVFLSIENAEFSELEESRSRYRLKDKQNRVTKPSTKISFSGVAKIVAKKVIIEVSGEDGFRRVIDQNATITFDNHCQKINEQDTYCQKRTEKDHSDFSMVYSVIKDKNDASKQFILEREPKDDFVSTGVHSTKVILKPTDTTNPKPKEPGLPCNSVIVSKPDDLP